MKGEEGRETTELVTKLDTWDVDRRFVVSRVLKPKKESGEQEREKEWTGGTESYSLAEKDGVTTLTVELNVPRGQEEMSKVRFPKALKRVKILAEK